MSQNFSFAEAKHSLGAYKTLIGHIGGFSGTVMLWMIKVKKGYNISQHCSWRGQALILSCPSSDRFNPHDYRLYLSIDFLLLWAFNLQRQMDKKGGEDKRKVTILSKASFRLNRTKCSVEDPSETIWKVPHSDSKGNLKFLFEASLYTVNPKCLGWSQPL